jgi:hypothetical protein
MMHKAGKNSEAGLPPPPEVIAGMGQLMQQMAQAGVLLAGEGLHSSSKAVRPHAHIKRVKLCGLAVVLANAFINACDERG